MSPWDGLAEGRAHPPYGLVSETPSAKFAEHPSLLKNSLGVRFHPISGTKHIGFGAFRARFVVDIGSMPTFQQADILSAIE